MKEILWLHLFKLLRYTTRWAQEWKKNWGNELPTCAKKKNMCCSAIERTESSFNFLIKAQGSNSKHDSRDFPSIVVVIFLYFLVKASQLRFSYE